MKEKNNVLMKETTKDSLNWINGNWRETERIEMKREKEREGRDGEREREREGGRERQRETEGEGLIYDP